MHIDWGDGAFAIYAGFSAEVDGWEVTDPQRFEAALRATENAVRLATVIAVGRFSRTVDVEDIRWAIALVRLSVDAAIGGLKQYMKNYLDLPDYCEAIVVQLRGSGGWLSTRDLMRSFRNKTRNLGKYHEAIAWLKAEQRIEEEKRQGATKPSPGWRLIEDEIISVHRGVGMEEEKRSE
jgi:hypothetical protein